MRDWIEIEVELLTPAFASGADQKSLELRPATIRGLLRWWWRAVVGHEEVSSVNLARREAQLFGGTSGNAIRSPVSIAIEPKKMESFDRADRLPNSGVSYQWRRGDKSGNSDPLVYLAYGPVRLLSRDERAENGSAKDPKFNEPNGRPKSGALMIRPAYKPEATFKLRLSWLPSRLTNQQIAELVMTASAWASLGGIGCRSRKGFGALQGQISAASSDQLLKDVSAIWEESQKNWQQQGDPLQKDELPDFPQLKYRMMHLTPQTYGRWEQALGAAGLIYKNAKGRGAEIWVTGEAKPRRSSSLLLTVKREGKQYRGVFCLLPCRKDLRSNAGNDLDALEAVDSRLPRLTSS